MNLCLVWLLQWVLSFGLIIGEHSWYEQINNPSVQLGSHTVYMEYGYFTPSCRDFICLERLLFPVHWYSQVSHLYVTPSCADFLWLIRLGLWEYSLLQTSHWYFLPSCTDWMCAVRILFVVASYSHWRLKSLRPWWHRAVSPANSKIVRRADRPVHHICYAGRIRPINSKIVRRAVRPVHHICYAGRSALLPAKWCAGRTALCSTFATQGSPPS